jgi:hypothetical protein
MNGCEQHHTPPLHHRSARPSDSVPHNGILSQGRPDYRSKQPCEGTLTASVWNRFGWIRCLNAIERPSQNLVSVGAAAGRAGGAGTGAGNSTSVPITDLVNIFCYFGEAERAPTRKICPQILNALNADQSLRCEVPHDSDSLWLWLHLKPQTRAQIKWFDIRRLQEVISIYFFTLTVDETIAEGLLELFPNNLMILDGLANYWLRLNQPARAQALYQRILFGSEKCRCCSKDFFYIFH